MKEIWYGSHNNTSIFHCIAARNKSKRLKVELGASYLGLFLSACGKGKTAWVAKEPYLMMVLF